VHKIKAYILYNIKKTL